MKQHRFHQKSFIFYYIGCSILFLLIVTLHIGRNLNVQTTAINLNKTFSSSTISLIEDERNLVVQDIESEVIIQGRNDQSFYITSFQKDLLCITFAKAHIISQNSSPHETLLSNMITTNASCDWAILFKPFAATPS